MGKAIINITMSVDGFIAGEQISKECPLGKNGSLLHNWIFDGKAEKDIEILTEFVGSVGAVIVGNRTYTTAIEDAWGGTSPFDSPAFVICHQRPSFIADGFRFIHDGIGAALSQAKIAAGDKNIWIMGGAEIAQQFLSAGLVDELHLHIAPVLLGAGQKLFTISPLYELQLQSSVATNAVLHLKYKV